MNTRQKLYRRLRKIISESMGFAIGVALAGFIFCLGRSCGSVKPQIDADKVIWVPGSPVFLAPGAQLKDTNLGILNPQYTVGFTEDGRLIVGSHSPRD